MKSHDERLLELETLVEMMNQRQFAMEVMLAHALHLLEQNGVVRRQEFAAHFAHHADRIRKGSPQREEELSLYDEVVELLDAAYEHSKTD